MAILKRVWNRLKRLRLSYNQRKHIAVCFYLMGKFLHRLGKDTADMGDWILYGYRESIRRYGN